MNDGIHIRPHLIIVLLLLASVLAACKVETDDTDSFVVADLFATPGKALATAELSPTPPATATIPNLPTPSAAPTLPLPTAIVLQQPTLPIGPAGPTLTPFVTLTPTPVACEAPPPMPFTPAWQNIAEVQGWLGCPVGEPRNVEGAFQVFEHGMMFWRKEDESIFAISELGIRQGQATDSWWRVDDTFEEGEPESDPGLEPPAGLIQPVRGFGKVWRDNAFIREALGWATQSETESATLWQAFDGGWMMTGPDGAPVYVMVPLDDPPYSSGFHTGPLP